MLELACVKQLGTFALDIAFTALPAQCLVLVGQSAAGKTTTLNLLAGLLHPDRGVIRLDDTTYFDSSTDTMVPAPARAIGYVFQDGALFPHLSVYENVAFGLRAQGQGRRPRRARVSRILEQMHLAELAARHPRELSGGQQQRVALARALVLQPRLLLLDEPLSALDAQTRRSVRTELRRTLANLSCVTLLVTHNPFDALVFGDRIAVLEDGQLVQVGGRDELLRRPRSRYVADLMGLNLFQGTVVARHADGLADVHTASGTLHIIPDVGGDELLVAVDPRDITIHATPPSGSAQNVFAGPVVELVPEPPFGERVRVVLATSPPLVADVTAHALHALNLREGARVYASFKAVAARSYT